MKKLISLLLLLVLCAGVSMAEVVVQDDPLPIYQGTWNGGKPVRSYHTDTLDYTVQTTSIEGCKCYITRVWMKYPGYQIKKATAVWEKDIQLPEKMASRIEGCALAINGSGYVSPIYPWIPENYPGTNSDYFYTPLGSLTVTDGKVYRLLQGVPYYGLTLQRDGLHLHVGQDPADVLAQEPSQTWSFYVECPMIKDHVSILDRSWVFANRHAARTIIAKLDDNNYLILTAVSTVGLTVVDATDFLLKNFDPEWAYDLDGGPSSALLTRNVGKKSLKPLFGGKAKDADVMGFVEYTE